MPQPAEGKHYFFRFKGRPTIEYWAEGGLVRVLDHSRAASGKHVDEYLISLQPHLWLERVIAVRSSTDKYPDEQAAMRRLWTEGVDCAKQAHRQGNPCDPLVQEHTIRHDRKNQIIIPGIDNGPLPTGRKIIDPTRYKIKQRDPRTTLLTGADVVPDFEVPLSRSITPERARRRQPA